MKLTRPKEAFVKVLGVITARGGSRGLPRKNILTLGDKPLIAYTIDAASKSKLDDVIVSTEDDEIAEISKKYGGVVPFMRPAELAQDSTTHVPVLLDALARYEKISGKKYDYILTLQPTTPFRLPEDINKSIAMADQFLPDCIVSLEKLVDISLEKLKYLDGDKVISAVNSEKELEGKPRQERKQLYRRNGAIYLTKREVLLNGSVYGENVLGFEMPAERSADINSYSDFLYAEFILSKQK